ncbi:MAG: UvrB/UvrC motif-containing protein [Phycisphaerae bacterium]|nr:UvrB/UvrC motif-containing protein [Phycisphaerae bacterium]
MKKKCDKCDNPATVHMTEITGGQKVEKHLCEDCAEAEGITIKTNVPISQLLEDFVLQTSSDAPDMPDLKCDLCGMTFGEYRDASLLGCPNDYEAFSPALVPMIVRAQNGADQHVGKVPQRADETMRKQNEILRLRSELKQAVHAEDYEQAANLRDQIKNTEEK